MTPSPRPKLGLVPLEDRTVPAVSPADVFAAAAQVQQARQVLLAVQAQPAYGFNVYTRAYLKSYLPVLTQQSSRSDAVLSEYQNSLGTEIAAGAARLGPFVGTIAALRFSAEVNAVYGSAFATRFGSGPVPGVGAVIPPDQAIPPTPVPPPPAPPVVPPPPTATFDKTTSAGLVATIPDLTDTRFVTQADGLRIADVVEGDGTAVKDGDTVNVFYTGFLASDGSVFDSNRTNATPAQFTTGGVIKGFAEGLIGLKPGGIRRLDIPAELGYGAAGSPPKIPANARLVFEIKLVNAPAAGTTAATTA